MQKRSRLIGLAMALLGSMVLLNNLGKPGIEVLRGSDVLVLVASDILLGVGFIGLLGRLRTGDE
jgi:hypothetical protein